MAGIRAGRSEKGLSRRKEAVMDEEQGLIIQNNVVTGCSIWMTHVEILAGVTAIAEGAFRNHGLNRVTIPAGLREVGAEAFAGCDMLHYVDFPSGLERIGERAFAGCLCLKRVVLPDTLRELSWDAFFRCRMLKKVELSPDNPLWRQEGRFLWKRDGTNLIWLRGVPGWICKVPEGVTQIPPHCFSAGNLEGITLPDSLEEIQVAALRNCRHLTVLRLPARLRRLEDRALADNALEEAVLPAGLRVLGDDVFLNVTALKRLVVLGELPEGWKTFSLSRLGIQPTESFDFQADRIPMMQISRGSQDALLRNFVRRWSAGEIIPEETRKNRLDFLRRRQKEYRQDPMVQNILLEEKLVGMKDVDGFLEEATQAGDTELVARLLEYQKRYIDLEEKARREKEKIRRDIRALTRPEPTLTELKRLWPGRVLEDGSWECRGYGGVSDSSEGIRELEVPAFLKKLPVTVIAAYAFSPEAKGRRNVIRGFLNSLKSIRLPDGIQTLGDHVFSGCMALEHVRLPEGLEELPESAFENCARLKRVELPSTLKRIRAGCFQGCVSLEELELSEGLEELGDGAFSECLNLKRIRLPRSLRSIGEEAFLFCQALKQIWLPDSLEEIHAKAFSECNLRCVVASPGSCGYAWAKSRRIRVQEP